MIIIDEVIKKVLSDPQIVRERLKFEKFEYIYYIMSQANNKVKR